MTGLESGMLTLALNGESTVTLSADGPFLFPKTLPRGTAYEVSVVEAPANTQVTLANASGVADRTVVDIAVNVEPTFPVGGRLSGLAANGSVSLQLNGGAPITLNADGPFTFPTRVARGSTYTVTLVTPATAQLTTLRGETGTVGNAAVESVAVHCGRWYHAASLAERFDVSPSGGYRPVVALNSAGNGVAVWHEYHNGGGHVMKAELNDGVWSKPTALQDAINPTGPWTDLITAAVSDNGDAVIAWVQFDSQSMAQVFKSERRNGTWSHPSGNDDNISPDGHNVNELTTAIDGNGDTIVAWTQHDGSDWHVYKSEYRAGAWTHPTLNDRLSLVGGSAWNVHAACDGQGGALVAWLQWLPNSDEHVLKSEYRAGSWQHPQAMADALSLPGSDAYDLKICGDGDGRFAVAWVQNDGVYYDAVYLAEGVHGTWTRPTSLADKLGPGGSWCWEPDVSAHHGALTVVWSQEADDLSDQVFMSNRRGGVWTHPASRDDYVSLHAPNAHAFYPTAAVDRRGNAVVIWRQWDGSEVRLLKSELLHGTWQHPSSMADGFSLPQRNVGNLALARGDACIVLMYESTGSNSQPTGANYPLLLSEYR